MQIHNSSKGYGAIPQAAHWLTVILVVVAWTLGLFGDDLPKGAPRGAGLLIHISAGREGLQTAVHRARHRGLDH